MDDMKEWLADHKGFVVGWFLGAVIWLLAILPQSP